MIKALLRYGKNTARITKEGYLLTQLGDLTQEGAERRLTYLSYLTDDGTQDGNNDLRVNGSTTPQTFFIAPQSDKFDLYVSSVLFTIADAGAVLNKFGNIDPLTNGCEFFYSNNQGERIIQSNLISNFRFGEMCGFRPAFGSGNSAFKANNVIGSSEAFIFRYDFKDLNGFSIGVRLTGGSNEKLGLRINDNITSIDLFTAFSYGFEFKKIEI